MYSFDYFTAMMRMPSHGTAGQERLRDAFVVVVGMGGLGCPAATALAYSGIGRLLLVDHDVVDKSNLNRQFLYRYEDVGKKKAALAAERLRPSVPGIVVDTITEPFEPANIEGASLVLDCTDSMSAKKAISIACRAARISLVLGAIYRDNGQICTFDFASGNTQGFEDVFDLDADQSLQQACSTVGVYGTHCMAVGAVMASEAIRYLIRGTNESVGQMVLINTNALRFDKVRLKKRSGTQASVNSKFRTYEPQLISLNAASESGFTIIDVRTPEEFRNRPSGYRNLPMREIMLDVTSLPPDDNVAFICETGARARVVCQHVCLKTGRAGYRFIAQ